MTFVPMLFDDIAQNLVNWIAGNPAISPLAPGLDMAEGSIERSHLEALAVQLESLEVRTAQAILDAIANSCYHAFGFDQLPAIPASGSVVFSALVAPTLPITIPSGTRVVSSTGQVFSTLANIILAAGQTSAPPVYIQADTAGSAGNLAANSITTMAIPLAGIDAVTNPAPTIGGGDPEPDSTRAQRFINYVQTLQRGTSASIEYAIVTNTQASLARVVEPWDLVPVPINSPYAGVAWVFAYDGSQSGLTGSVASNIAQVLNGYLDSNGNQVAGWKAAGVQMVIFPAQVISVSVRGTVTLSPTGGGRWDDIQANLTAAARTYFNTLRIGDSVSYAALSTALNTCDPDIVSVVLQAWVDNTVPNVTPGASPAAAPVPGPGVPGYPSAGVIPMAQDLDPKNVLVNPAAANNPYVCGSICVLNAATETVNSNVITYPEWVLA